MSRVPRSVVCAGLVTVDLVHVVDALPGPDEKVVGVAERIEVGGPAANAARVAAALGLQVTVIAPFGQSPLTGFVRSALSGEGVEWIDPVAEQPNLSPMSTVIVTRATGARAVISGGAPPAALATDRLADLAFDAVAGADAVLIDGHGGLLAGELARAGRARRIPVLLDGGSHKPGMEAWLPQVDLALLSADFRSPDGSDPLTWCLAAGAAMAAASAGPASIRLRLGPTEQTIAVPPAHQVVDTLGAGDVLHGAALAALAYACDPSTYAAVLAFAAQVATASVEFPGALGWATDPSTLARVRGAIAALR
ncbi:MAG: PfkB family carbohydrate kinase [Dermatophilaceae bacterium]